MYLHSTLINSSVFEVSAQDTMLNKCTFQFCFSIANLKLWVSGLTLLWDCMTVQTIVYPRINWHRSINSSIPLFVQLYLVYRNGGCTGSVILPACQGQSVTWPSSMAHLSHVTLIASVIVYLVSPAPFLISHYCLFGGYQDGLCNNPTLKSTDLGAGRVESNFDSTDKEVGGREILLHWT